MAEAPAATAEGKRGASVERRLEAADRAVAWVENVFAAAALAVLVLVTAGVCAEVAFRYGLAQPITWIVEVTEYSLLYITFLGTSWVLRRGGHIRVDLFVVAMPERAQMAFCVIASLIGVIIALVLTVFGTQVTIEAWARGAFKPTTLQAPTWMVLAAIPIGSAALLARFAVNAGLYAHAFATGRKIGSLAELREL